MSNADQELLDLFVCEANDNLADIENQLLAIESGGDDCDTELVNTVFRAIHSIKGGAGFLGLQAIGQLAHSMEHLLDLFRSHKLPPTSERIDVLLRAADTLRGLINNVATSNDADISAHIEALHHAAKDDAAAESEPASTATDDQQPPRTTTSSNRSEAPVETSDDGPAEASSAADAPDKTPAESGPSDAMKTAEQEQKQEGGTQAQKPSDGESPANRAAGQSEHATTKAKTDTATATNRGTSPGGDASLRVRVQLLDHLMNLAGELVLCRNQLLQLISSEDHSATVRAATRLDQVTSELQEAIMQTRLQPIGNVFNRFPRVVRDLGNQLGKQCRLEITGKEVEVDKSISEAIGDPLTHLIRNAMDHGIETPEERKAKGKSPTGLVQLMAYHQAGKVCIDIRDDGAGIDPQRLKDKAIAKGLITEEQAKTLSSREAVNLIFHPGFSTAEKVTAVSGRGVGMDVVRTNIEGLGGTVDVISELGHGTTFRVTLPVTLAIIPTLLVRSRGQRFAVPQANVAEIVRVRSEEAPQRIRQIKNASVLFLRNALLPLVYLNEVLQAEAQELTPQADDNGDTARGAGNAIHVVVVETGSTRFGLVVDTIDDSKEIVVKPLGRHLKNCECFAGATILGDGSVSLILDLSGIATLADLRALEERTQEAICQQTETFDTETENVLVFENAPRERFAIPMGVINRVERLHSSRIDSVGGRKLVQCGSDLLPLIELTQAIPVEAPPTKDHVFVVVFDVAGKEVGLIAPSIVDIRNISTNVDTLSCSDPGVVGSLTTDGCPTRLLDVFRLAEKVHPEWFNRQSITTFSGKPPTILLVEDAAFFRQQVSGFLKEQGCAVVTAEDGLEAWDILLSENHAFDLVITDIEMPNMDGLELSRRIRDWPTLAHLPIIALTSLASSEDIRRSRECGIDEHLVKLNRERMIAAVSRLLRATRKQERSPHGERAEVLP